MTKFVCANKSELGSLAMTLTSGIGTGTSGIDTGRPSSFFLVSNIMALLKKGNFYVAANVVELNSTKDSKPHLITGRVIQVNLFHSIADYMEKENSGYIPDERLDEVPVLVLESGDTILVGA